MYFAEADTVSIHTLSAAAHEVLRAIIKTKGRGSVFKDSDWILPERAKEYYNLINAPQNFFKHAATDLNAALNFNPETTLFLMFDCALMYKGIAGRDLRESRILLAWFLLKYPNTVKPVALSEMAKKIRTAENLTRRYALK